MTANYRDFTDAEADSGNGYAGRKLAERFVISTRRLNDTQYVCDLLCGNRYLPSRLGGSGMHVTGVDVSASCLELARQHYANDKPNFIHEKIGTDLEGFLHHGVLCDVIASSNVIEHLYGLSALVETRAKPERPSRG